MYQPDNQLQYSDPLINHSHSYEDTDPLLAKEKHEVKYRATKIRWLALAFACFSCLGNYFCNDLPPSLQTVMMEKLDIPVFTFNLIYSVYSFPNIILPFLGGFFIDRLGIRFAFLLFSAMVIIGQIVSTFGAARLDFVLILIGRVIFGFGGDTLIVAKSAIIAKWFMGKELSFALGAGLCIARLGSSLNSFISPKLFDWTQDLYFPYLVGTMLCFLSCVAVLGLNYIDKKADIEEGKMNMDARASEKVGLRDMKSFKFLFYLLLINAIFLYGGFFGLTNNVNNLMVMRFGFTPSGAGNIIPIIYICPVVLTPLLGMLVDKKGKRILLLLFACIIFVIVHLFIAFLPDGQPDSPNYAIAGGLLGVGLFYSTYASVFWPCIALSVGQKLSGIAYGIAYSCKNSILAVMPLVLGVIHDKTENYKHGYFWTEITLAGFVSFGVITTTWIYFEDKKKGGQLDKPGTK